MTAKVLRFPTRVAEKGDVWCEPLQIFFPPVFRLHFSSTMATDVRNGGAIGRRSTRCAFSLFGEASPSTGILKADRVHHLLPEDNRSLIVRHHWDSGLAEAYLHGVEDTEPQQPTDGIFEIGDDVFTISKCRTRASWSGPRIFYLAELYDRESEVGVETWEMSVGVDGRRSRTDIFHSYD